MKVPMRIEDGKLVPPSGIKFLADRAEVVVELPSDALELPDSPARRQLDAIFGVHARPRPARDVEADKRRWREHLEHKYR